MLALVGGTLIDGRGGKPVPDAVVLVDGKAIVAAGPAGDIVIPDGSTVLKASGSTIMPGLVDMHVHLVLGRDTPVLWRSAVMEPLMGLALKAFARARRTLEMGFTTLRDAADIGWCACHLRDAIQAGLIEGPRLFACGQYLTPTGGHGDMIPSWVTRTDDISIVVDGPIEARKAVRRQVKAGTDWVKVVATGAGNLAWADQDFTDEEFAVFVDEAHRRGRRVCAHACMAKGTLAAVKAGVDSIEHGIDLTDEIIALMLEKGVYLVPTCYAIRAFIERGVAAGLPAEWVESCKPVLEPSIKSFQLALNAGVKIACGSDVGMCTQPHATNAQELGYMVEYGMAPMDALVAATRVAASVLGVEHLLGTVEKGKLADLLVLRGDPLRDITLLQKQENILLVMKEGRSYVDKLSDRQP